MDDLIQYFIPDDNHRLRHTKRDDVQSWADENDMWIGISQGGLVYFKSENDLTMFLLRWS
jgi:hypothetical protein